MIPHDLLRYCAQSTCRLLWGYRVIVNVIAIALERTYPLMI